MTIQCITSRRRRESHLYLVRALRTVFCIAVILVSMMTGVLKSMHAQDSKSLRIAAAADLRDCLPRIVEQIQLMYPGMQIEVSYGSSGLLFAQIENGAPFDVFMSADSQYPERLVEEGKADASTLFVYGFGHLVLWTANPDLDLSSGAEILKSNQIRKIAIANPHTAPYGRAAEQFLRNLKIWDEISDKLVFADSVAQAAEFVHTRNADVGLISLSLIQGSSDGSYVTLDGADSVLKQSMVVTSRGSGNRYATLFLSMVKSGSASKILTECGFSSHGD